MTLPLVGRKAAFLKQTAKIAIGADIVKSMIMHSDMGEVRSHETKCSVTANAKHFLIPRRIILQDSSPILESLCPLGPSTGGIFPLNGKNWRSIGILPAFLKRGDFRGGSFKDFVGC